MFGRRTHWLTTVNSLPQVTDFIAVDTETRNEHGKVEAGRHRLHFGVYIARVNGVRQHLASFTYAREFWRRTDRLCRKRLIVYAHNWNFDGAILSVPTLLEFGWKCVTYINDGVPPVIVEFRKGKRVLLLIDTLNYFRNSLDVLGESLGLPKLEMPQNDSAVDWYKYASRDVEIVYEAIVKLEEFAKHIGLDGLPYTIGSMAFAYWRNMLGNPIQIHSHTTTLDLERFSYKGGRSESFRRGVVSTDLFYLDVNSMYPYLMSVTPVPTRLDNYYQSASPLAFMEALDSPNLSLVADVTLRTDREAYGVILDGRLTFPVGRFRGVFTKPELEYAYDNDHIYTVHSFATYEAARPFSEYVSTLYPMRAEYKADGNIAFEYFVKIMLNSLYGKLGQRNAEWQEIDILPTEMRYIDIDGVIYTVRNVMGAMQVQTPRGEAYNSFPAIAATITGAGRILLWNLIEKAQAHGGTVFYCDTDSLVVDRKGYEALKDLEGSELGMLKLEGTFTRGQFYAAKDYYLDNKAKIKGVRKAVPGVRQYRQLQFASWHKYLLAGETGYIDISYINKNISGTNTKRIADTGSCTTPRRMV